MTCHRGALTEKPPAESLGDPGLPQWVMNSDYPSGSGARIAASKGRGSSQEMKQRIKPAAVSGGRVQDEHPSRALPHGGGGAPSGLGAAGWTGPSCHARAGTMPAARHDVTTERTAMS